MATARTPREAWVEAAMRALAAGGPDSVRVEVLARELGVTKGGFYWHFADRAALLQAVLDTWEQVMIDDVIAQVDSAGGDARARLRRLFALASSSGALLPVDLAVRDWARRDKAVARRLRRVDNRRMAFMRTLFGGFCDDADEVEARCVLAFSLFIGSHFMATDHEGRSRRDVLALVLDRLMA